LKEVAEKIAQEIRTGGIISFARFMELALYCPVYGYYEREGDTAGRRGDYYTIVMVGSLFAELLAFQFAEWLEEGRGAKGEGRTQLAEAGAHNGRLAKDILIWMRQNRPEIFSSVQYRVVEPSARRRELQQRNLLEFGARVQWAENLCALAEALGPGGVRGIIFSNELLDAMPVHRLGWDAGRRVWFEWGVTIQEGRFVWERMPSENSAFQDPPPSLKEVLPDGFTREVSPAAEEWWRQAARIVACGKLLAIDYGQTAEEFYAPERKDGTLRGYYRHHGTTQAATCSPAPANRILPVM
jgi:SAM-dependent MidA family methyltransferase